MQIPPPRRPLEGVLLDVDGTLIDSNDAHAQSWVETFADFGYAIAFDRVRPLMGKGGDKLLPELTGVESDSPQGRKMARQRAELFRSNFLPNVRALPGAHQLLARMRHEGLRLVIATSANEEELDALLEQTGLEELVNKKTSSSDADRSKPDPDIISAALRRGRLEPGRVVMLGDTPYDVEAAAKAGVATIALRSGGWWSDDALSDALAIYDGPAALLRDFDRSPLARSSG